MGRMDRAHGRSLMLTSCEQNQKLNEMRPAKYLVPCCATGVKPCQHRAGSNGSPGVKLMPGLFTIMPRPKATGSTLLRVNVAGSLPLPVAVSPSQIVQTGA